MIKKLKRRFTVLATVSMILLMAVLVTIMNIVNYQSVVNESDTVLDVLSQPDLPSLDKKEPEDEPHGRNMDDFVPVGMSPEVPYESRYFTVTVSENGELLTTDLSRIISVDDDSVRNYITRAYDSGDTKGFVDEFRYSIYRENGGTKFIFLDCGRKLDAYRRFFWISIIVGFFGCVIGFAGFLLVSGKITAPISEAYEKQKRFISDAGHEIKTPLTIINANVDLLECEGEKEEFGEIRAQTQRLTDLTNNLVMLSKMEETAQQIQKIEMPLSDIVTESAGSFQAPAISKNIDYTVNAESGITVTASPDALRRLVSILLENAVKYTPEGGKIELELTKSKKNAYIRVTNTTETKIEEASLGHVFDRFYRTDNSRNSSTGGHGIGLSIAKAIVDGHGGNIYASTETGFDFRITVTLPI